MIQDINAVFDNQYRQILPSPHDSGICIKDGRILLKITKGNISLPPVSEAKEIGVYLFSLNSVNFFEVKMEESDNYLFYSIRDIRNLSPKSTVFAVMTAYHICNWYSNNNFCGACGKAMRHSKTERARICECGSIKYPQIAPAVIVAIINDDKILLTKYNRPNAGWALVAGYNEVGETIEQTVHREVFEETGLQVKNLRYYKSQPWGLTSSLLFGFICEVDGIDTINLDNNELSEAKWFKRNEIDFEDDGISLTREMIIAFKNNRF